MAVKASDILAVGQCRECGGGSKVDWKLALLLRVLRLISEDTADVLCPACALKQGLIGEEAFNEAEFGVEGSWK